MEDILPAKGEVVRAGGRDDAILLLSELHGLAIPLHLYGKLATANAARTLNAPLCRNRYGFLFVRFKPGRWGAEFFILGRKSLQLLVTTVFAEQFWRPAVPAASSSQTLASTASPLGLYSVTVLRRAAGPPPSSGLPEPRS